jgi:hypothetical protein
VTGPVNRFFASEFKWLRLACCLVAGAVAVLAEARIGPSRVDEYASLASVVFLVSAISSYMAMRYEGRSTISARCELVADQAFLVGLIGIAIISLFFAYEII